jgi:hypothetical protein
VNGSSKARRPRSIILWYGPVAGLGNQILQCTHDGPTHLFDLRQGFLVPLRQHLPGSLNRPSIHHHHSKSARQGCPPYAPVVELFPRGSAHQATGIPFVPHHGCALIWLWLSFNGPHPLWDMITDFVSRQQIPLSVFCKALFGTNTILGDIMEDFLCMEVYQDLKS